jgi:perosamine synthetase
MFYLIPPAGTPVTCGDIIKIKMTRLRPTRAGTSFTEAIKNHTSTSHCFLLGSGRAAQTILLKALAELAAPGKDEVIIPAYTCYSVPASVARAGLKVRLVDINPETLDYDYDKLRKTDFSAVLALNASNLFGLVSNWRELNPLAAEHSVYLIDDAAQTMGALYDNRPSGSFGDAGFYSLDRGKNLSTFAGGVLVTKSEKIAEKISNLTGQLKEPGLFFEASLMTKIFLYSLMLRPWLYWLPASLPFLGLGKTIYDENFPLTKLSKIQTAAGTVMFQKLQAFNRQRKENARAMATRIIEDRRYTVPGYDPEHCPAYLRLPVLAENRTERDRLVNLLRKNHIAASTMYPDIIRNISQIESRLADDKKDFPGARQVVERLFTLPTHPYVRKRDIDKITSCLGVS